jgi:hypothetical protein
VMALSTASTVVPSEGPQARAHAHATLDTEGRAVRLQARAPLPLSQARPETTVLSTASTAALSVV